MVVGIGLELETPEDLKTLIKELPVEDESSQPESSVFLEDLLVDSWCDLDLAVNSDRQTAGVELTQRISILKDDFLIICVLIEPLLVNKAESLIDQNVRVLCLVSVRVLHQLLHRWVVCILLHIGFIIVVFATEALFWDLFGVEMLDLSIIELVPVAFSILARFSILDK